ncbi:alpha/beta hydrolase [Cupriavidus pauculus]|jgi:acetyl esterase/lipase|uniref:Alpha/beta hydrolase n=1 Tax=Cupriavidus pauculus TaxID=82633 RepID=A0A5P2H2F2_9BURK|nr:alpha/beta hydrolase [Cupriavidus pauculus]QET02152.1 alpha/beta hydrolase [Cupriavidus pauculus]
MSARAMWRVAATAFLLSIGGCSTVDALNALTPSGDYIHLKDIAYAAGDRGQLDVYVPREPACGDKAPVVVFFYGGTWNSGSRADYAFVGANLARHGILTVIADYRLYPEVTYPDFLTDSAQAVAWTLRSIAAYRGDPSRVFVMGHSAGAYNAAMIALDKRWLTAAGASPTQLRGWIGLAGPYDFLPIVNPDAQPVFHHPNYPADSQPIDLVTRQSPPSFIGVDIGDRLVDPERNSRQMTQKLRAAGVPVTHREYGHLSHTLLIGVFSTPLRWLSPVSDDVSAFVLSGSGCGGKG